MSYKYNCRIYAPKIRYVKENTGEIKATDSGFVQKNRIRNISSEKEDIMSTVEAIWAICKNGVGLPQISLVG